MRTVELTLNDTTPREVLARLPKAEVVTAFESDQPGRVDVMFTDVEEEEARRLATEAGFSVG